MTQATVILTLLLDFCLLLNTCCVYVTRFVEILLAYVLIFSGLDEIVANDVLLLSESLTRVTKFRIIYYFRSKINLFIKLVLDSSDFIIKI